MRGIFMCRGGKDGVTKRCEGCNEPERRRARQNLAYAVNKEKGSVTASSNTDVDTKEPTTLAEALAQEAKLTGFEEFDEAAIAETMASMLADPKVAKAVSADVRNDRLNAENNKAWLLNGREDTPENLAAGIAERQEQIIMVGTVIGERAQAIHGVDIDAAREDWAQRLQEAQDEYAERRKETDEKTADWHRRRREMSEEKDVSVFNLASHMTEEERDEISALGKIKMDANVASMEAHLKVQEIMTGEDKETRVLMEKISEGNRKAIAEVREVGNVPAEFRNTIRGGADVAKTFGSVIGETFPDEWVQKSNELGDLALKRVSNGRAHYQQVPDTQHEFRFSMNKKPDFNDDRFHDWKEKLDENGNPTGKWHGLKRDFLEPKNYSNFKKYDGDKPKGTGWKPGKALTPSGKVVHGWVRDNATDVKAQKAKAKPEAEITVYMNESAQQTRRVITHEFSHRVEDANPHIPMLEEGFLASRTTMADGRRETLKVYKQGVIQGSALRNDGKREVVREDNFVSPYMGKEYLHSSREILSMGSEAVFSGSQGGLVGIGNTKSDPQMRNWILGVYATM
jgi:hypothetical protein